MQVGEVARVHGGASTMCGGVCIAQQEVEESRIRRAATCTKRREHLHMTHVKEADLTCLLPGCP